MAIAALLAAVAVLLAVSGGVRATVGGFRISARSPVPAAVMAAVVAGAWWVLARRAQSVIADLDESWSALERHATSVVMLAAAMSGAVAAGFATNSASGADASGYLSEAAQWAAGRISYQEPLAGILGALDPWLTAPLGWRPGPFPGWQSPTYPPGLPVLMALPHAFGGVVAAGLVVASAAALATFSTGMIAARMAGGVAGILAAVLIATSPVFLFQSVQPMSDVPVTAAWMLTWVLLIRRVDKLPERGAKPSERGDKPLERGDKPPECGDKPPECGDKPLGLSFSAGVVCALAVLIRPNLAPLAAVPLFAIGLNLRRLMAFSLPVGLAAAGLMWLQWQWYGSPLRSGYGTAGELFALANIGANASRYSAWLAATSPVLLVAPIGLALLWRHQPAKAMAVFAALAAGAYLVYAVFDDWSYLRFLLPAMAVAAIFAGVAFAAGVQRLGSPWRAAALLTVCLGVVAHGVSEARNRDAFRLADQQRRVSQAAGFVARALPAGTVIISGEQSGSLRYYTGRSILRWDAATAESLAAALTVLGASGRPVVIALDAWERELFRAKFRGVDSVSLEWPPAFEAGTSHRMLVWRLGDRDAFPRGERVATIRQP